MTIRSGQRMRFAPAADAPRQARRALRHALAGAGLDQLDELAETVLLLASELCDNALLHAGTEFEVELQVDPDSVTVSVSDHGPSPLEQHLRQPRARYGRAPNDGRGLMLVQRLANSWGTRHDADGENTTWFAVHRDGPGAVRASRTSAVAPLHNISPPVLGHGDKIRALLRIPPVLAQQLDAGAVVTELTRRLREVLDLDEALVEIDYGDGSGTREIAHDGRHPDGDQAPARALDIPLPLTAPLRGRLRLSGAAEPLVPELAELAALRIAIAVESDYLHKADRRRRDWMAYLADTSQLLGQSLDVELTITVIPQILVPRLGQWCAVHLVEPAHGLELAALTHANEELIPELRSALTLSAGGDPIRRLRAQLRQLATQTLPPTWINWPTDAIALSLHAAGRAIGVLTIGRPGDRSHSPEDVALISDIAQRAALAIDNAQRATRHIETSQALQRALFPRELPIADGVEFAADYLPASTGSDVGGDFYDVLSLRAGLWLAAIGDVCGKGARAAARAGQVRDMLRVLVRDGRPLARALKLLNDHMIETGDHWQYCTLAAAHIRKATAGKPTGLAVDLVLAGHEPPLLIRANGTAEFVGQRGTPLGLLNHVKLYTTRLHIAPGDVLLAYTDGVIERRGPQGLYGAHRLITAASATCPLSAAQLIATVRTSVQNFSNEDPKDDIALLAIRATKPR
ncbi:MAG: stage II sporulation protein E [Pseudonocardiales bacterium]|nr:SpoIIE family protein phosphatase [Actinomycetota bacterium]PZS12145.1 MAG: stage II sporulation protein E [Pseudonocardiales bacterium]